MDNEHRHLYHIVNISVWPIFSAFSAFFLLSGLSFYMHRIQFGGYFFFLGFFLVVFCVFFWFSDIIEEASLVGYHTLVVRTGLRIGFVLFVISELMLFIGFFWAFFHSSLCPSFALGGQWPPIGIIIIPVLDFPIFNTGLLLVSGLSITWAHRAVSIGSFIESINSFLITTFLGSFFIILQFFEYYEAFFNISDSVYASTFYMLTGLHGLHVIIGVSFIFICFIRLLYLHFTVRHYLGFVFAIWYWHFVDAIWILLFFCVYAWGSW